MTRPSFHRPGWTCVTRTRRPANSLRVKPRSWQRRRARRSSSTRSAGYLRCDRARFLDGSSSAPGAAHRHGWWRGWPRPGRRGAVPAQKPAGLRPPHSPQPRKHPAPATTHQQAPAPEVAGAELGWARGCTTGAPCRRGIPENADEPRNAVLLGALPQPASRQHDVTGHHGTDLPDRCWGRCERPAVR